MPIVNDLVKSVVDSALGEILRKVTGTRKRARRRTTPRKTGSIASRRSPTSVLRRIEELFKPAKRQTSRKRTVRARSKTRRRSA